jgi:putative transposase
MERHATHAPIAVEDLNVSGMVRNRSLARAISCTGWGEFRRQLEYKCHRHGRNLAVIDRWYPSSKTCSACGHLLARLSLSTRHWTCPVCRARHDRDINAAKNILAAGLAVTACGGNRKTHRDTPGAGPGETGTRRCEPRESPSFRAGKMSNFWF